MDLCPSPTSSAISVLPFLNGNNNCLFFSLSPCIIFVLNLRLKQTWKKKPLSSPQNPQRQQQNKTSKTITKQTKSDNKTKTMASKGHQFHGIEGLIRDINYHVREVSLGNHHIYSFICPQIPWTNSVVQRSLTNAYLDCILLNCIPVSEVLDTGKTTIPLTNLFVLSKLFWIGRLWLFYDFTFCPFSVFAFFFFSGMKH